MKTRPIIFSGPMIRAILSGEKTQTRRVVSPAPPPESVRAELCNCPPGSWGSAGKEFHFCREDLNPHWQWHLPCRYGMRGDRLWVRETWRVSRKHDAKPPRDLPPKTMTVFFEAGGTIANQENGMWQRDDSYPNGLPEWAGKLRPSIHMPSWASRLTLEIVGVRVERLQDITEADAIAEGAMPSIVGGDLDHLKSRAGFQSLWETICGAGSWSLNPFVWVVEFKRLTP